MHHRLNVLQRCLLISSSLFFIACGDATNDPTADTTNQDLTTAPTYKSATPDCGDKVYTETITAEGGCASGYGVEHACKWAHMISSSNAEDAAIANGQAAGKLTCNEGCIPGTLERYAWSVSETVTSSGKDSKAGRKWLAACKSFMVYAGGNPADCDKSYARSQPSYCNVSDTYDVTITQHCDGKDTAANADRVNSF